MGQAVRDSISRCTGCAVSTMVAPRFSVGLALINSPLKVIMVQKTSQSELTRLRKEQNKARQNEVFGGLSPAERAEYNGKAERIHDLESEIQASAVAGKRLEFAKLEQRKRN